LLLWAPRHPERFRPVIERVQSAGLRAATRSADRMASPEDAVFVIDTLGELPMFFGASDVAFVGGSLQDIGGHNLLEPAAAGVPIVTGPHLHNFAEIADALQQAGALTVVDSEEGLGDALDALLGDPTLRAQMGAAGRALAESGRGALARTLTAVKL